MDGEGQILKNVLVQNDIELPGSDAMRTAVLLLFQVLLLFLIDKLFIDIKEIRPYQDYSRWFILGSMLFSIISIIQGQYVLHTNVKEVNINTIFYAKTLIGVSIILSFITLCFWVILLGGVLKSPFASILSVSPILLIIQYFRDRNDKKAYKKILVILNEDSDNEHPKATGWVRKFIAITEKISIVPILIVIITITIGEFLSTMFHPSSFLLNGKLNIILRSNRFHILCYIVYYSSILVVVYGIMPREVTRRLSRKFGL